MDKYVQDHYEYDEQWSEMFDDVHCKVLTYIAESNRTSGAKAMLTNA